jgi:hypothetical protein
VGRKFDKVIVYESIAPSLPNLWVTISLIREGIVERLTVPPPVWGRLGGGSLVVTNYAKFKKVTR